ncbi:MAG: caspase family protein, partial [Candidatus Tectomicrobia bacterium]
MRRSIAFTWLVIAGLLVVTLSSACADTLTVTVSHANVRGGPGITHPILTTVPRDAIFSLLERRQDWYKIRLDDGREGWIAGSIVKVAQEPRGLRLTARPVSPPRRIALVIGNAAYASAPLRNPVNDATDIAATLRQLTFDVTLLRDADFQRMEDALTTFSRQLRQGGTGLFYFAGHGVQVRGENYLIPLGARLDREQDVRYKALPVGQVLGAMEDAANGFNIVILDACRNNPFARRWRSSQRGLAVVQVAGGSLIAYA